MKRSWASVAAVLVAVTGAALVFASLPEAAHIHGGRLVPSGIALVAALLAAALLGVAHRPVRLPEPASIQTRPDDMVGQMVEERETLVGTLAELAGQLPPALADRARDALGRVGVTEVAADGQRFDPQRHSAVGSTPVTGPGQADLVARTERTGFDDRGRLVTRPMVVVFVEERSGDPS